MSLRIVNGDITEAIYTASEDIGTECDTGILRDGTPNISKIRENAQRILNLCDLHESSASLDQKNAVLENMLGSG